jgi:hypothetical protein
MLLNAMEGFLLGFYIFGVKRLHNNYIQPCKAKHVWLFIERLG